MGIYLVLSCALLCCPGVSPVLSWAFPCSPARSCAPLCPHVLSCAFLGSPCSPVLSCALLCALLGSLVLAWAFLRCSLRALLRLLGSPVLFCALMGFLLSCAILCFICSPGRSLLRFSVLPFVCSPALSCVVCVCVSARVLVSLRRGSVVLIHIFYQLIGPLTLSQGMIWPRPNQLGRTTPPCRSCS